MRLRHGQPAVQRRPDRRRADGEGQAASSIRAAGRQQAEEGVKRQLLWISYFWSYLGEKGRAGFVMSSQASGAGHGERNVRQKIVQTGDMDVMIAIRSNFFYTRTVPCELWFFNRGKPKERREHVLMLDARNVFRKINRNRVLPEPSLLVSKGGCAMIKKDAVWQHKAHLPISSNMFDGFPNEGRCDLFVRERFPV